MKPLIVILFLGCGIFPWSSLITAQDIRLPLYAYSIQEGLSNSTVYSILQDSLGFMWFGTADQRIKGFPSFYQTEKRSSCTPLLQDNSIWTSNGASISIRVLPHWAQTWQFRVLVISLILMAILGGYAYKTHIARQQKLELQRLVQLRIEALSAEKEKRKEEAEFPSGTVLSFIDDQFLQKALSIVATGEYSN